MFELMLASLLICSPAKIINETKVWDKMDQQLLDLAYRKCSEIYSDAPCLKSFTKTKTGDYRVLCGAYSEIPRK